MTIIKINAITVETDSGDELAKRFAARAGAVDNQEGFEGFELKWDVRAVSRELAAELPAFAGRNIGSVGELGKPLADASR